MAPNSLLLDLREDIDKALLVAGNTGGVQTIDRLLAEVEANPKWPDVRYRLACRLMVAGRLSEALAHLDAALKINGQFADALRLKARILTDRGELRAALDTCRLLNRYVPHGAEGFLAEAVLHARLGDHASAIGAARNAIELDRTLVDAQVLLGEQYLTLGDDRLARSHLELALKLRPHEDISYLLAVICLQQSDVASAESHFRRALEANPKHLSSMVRLAMLKIADGDYPEAYRLLTEAMSFYPRYPDLQYGLGRVCLLMGKREEAYKQMTAALELNPEYAEVRREIALACDGADLAEAADHMRRSVEADPSDEQAVVNLGYLYHRQGEPDRAIEVLERATNQFPDSWRILKTLTILNLHRRSIPQAKLCFEMASRINPELQSIERSLRVVFNDESLLDDERLQLEEKFSSPESKGELYHHLGRLHLDFQKDRLASQYFRQSMEVGFDPVRNLMMLATYHGNSSDFVSAINLLDGIKAEGFAENVRRLMLGLFHANSGDHETSTRYYQQVMTDSPLFFHALGELAVCFRERGEYDDLLDDYLDYSRYNERNAPLTRRIALALANKGLLADARRHFDHATILDEDDGEAFHALGLLSLLRLDYVEAIRHFKTAAHRAPDSPLPQLALALTQLEVGDRFNGQLSLQRYIFVETADCWREMAEKLNLKLDRQET